MENSKKANATNAGINLQADALTDLPVTHEQADEIKGGQPPHVKVFSSSGISEARGDVNGDGFDDIIVGSGPGAVGGHVK